MLHPRARVSALHVHITNTTYFLLLSTFFNLLDIFFVNFSPGAPFGCSPPSDPAIITNSLSLCSSHSNPPYRSFRPCLFPSPNEESPESYSIINTNYYVSPDAVNWYSKVLCSRPPRQALKPSRTRSTKSPCIRPHGYLIDINIK